MTQTRMSGKNPDSDPVHNRKLESRRLHYKDEELTVKAANRKTPQAKFSRVDLGGGAFIWAPTNSAGEDYLRSLPEKERNEFLYHKKPIPVPPSDRPESHRVVDGRPVKAAPRGVRENELFPEKSASLPSKRSTSRTISATDASPVSEEEINKIREAISNGTF